MLRTSSHSAVLSLSGQSTALTSSSSTSAAVPGRLPRPPSLNASRSLDRGQPRVAAPWETSSGLKAWMWMPGAACFAASRILRYVAPALSLDCHQ